MTILTFNLNKQHWITTLGFFIMLFLFLQHTISVIDYVSNFEFLETQEVEVVSALWIADEIWQLPAHYESEEIGKAIRNEEQPGYMWDAFRVHILYTASMHITFTVRIHWYKQSSHKIFFLQQTTKLLDFY